MNALWCLYAYVRVWATIIFQIYGGCQVTPPKPNIEYKRLIEEGSGLLRLRTETIHMTLLKDKFDLGKVETVEIKLWSIAQYEDLI